MEPLVSIIVPIFNVEPYLRKCVDSIIEQTYRNLEIILVDDGSPDNCSQICDEYKEKDSRVMVIHKPNGGLSDARNAGLDVATGEYVTFIDSDDWYENNTISVIINEAIQGQFSIISYACAIVSEQQRKENVLKDEELSSFDYVIDLCEEKKFPSVCTKLFYIELIGNTRFKKGRLNEDFLFMMSILQEAECQVKIIPFVGYNYYQREGSITHSASKGSVIDAVKNCLDLFANVADDAVDLKKAIARMGLYQTSVMSITFADSDRKEKDKNFRIIKESIRIFSPYRKQKTLPKRDRMVVTGLLIAPKITIHTLSILWRIKCRIKKRK